MSSFVCVFGGGVSACMQVYAYACVCLNLHNIVCSAHQPCLLVGGWPYSAHGHSCHCFRALTYRLNNCSGPLLQQVHFNTSY